VKSAEDIGLWFISRGLDNPKNTLEGNTKLQKLLFFSWLIHSSKFNEQLFENDFFAYQNGPVIETVRKEYKENYSDLSKKPIPHFSLKELETFKIAEDIFGSLDSGELVKISHNSPAWKKYNDLFLKEQKCDQGSNKLIIPKEELEEELSMIQTVLFAYENMC
jgi:uncharacterized phage-associated protein